MDTKNIEEEGEERVFRVEARAPLVLKTSARSARAAAESLTQTPINAVEWPEEAVLAGCGLLEVYEDAEPRLSEQESDSAEHTKTQIIARRLQFELLRAGEDLSPTVFTVITALSGVVAMTLAHNNVPVSAFTELLETAATSGLARRLAHEALREELPS